MGQLGKTSYNINILFIESNTDFVNKKSHNYLLQYSVVTSNIANYSTTIFIQILNLVNLLNLNYYVIYKHKKLTFFLWFCILFIQMR